MGDVADAILLAPEPYDAILLDVDNGPDGLVRPENNRIYSRVGLQAARSALTSGGILTIWSAAADPAFTRRLEKARFDVEVLTIRARPMAKARATRSGLRVSHNRDKIGLIQQSAVPSLKGQVKPSNNSGSG